MEPVYLSIQQEATGKRMKTMIRDRGYSVKDIQEAMGFENPQAVYKWLSGKSLPSLDNFLILSRILHTSIEDILVVDGDIAVLKGGTTRRLDKYKKEEKEKNGNQDSDNDFDPSSADNALIPFQHDNAGESNDNKSDGENISKVSPPLSRVVM